MPVKSGARISAVGPVLIAQSPATAPAATIIPAHTRSQSRPRRQSTMCTPGTVQQTLAAMDRIWVNGALVDAKTATVPALDRGVLWGQGLFETMRVYSGKVWALSDHLDRLSAG